MLPIIITVTVRIAIAMLTLVMAVHGLYAQTVNTIFLWQIETVSTGERCFDTNVSLALGENDLPHLSYYAWDEGDLLYGMRGESGWESMVVDSSEYVGRHSSLALDSAGYVHISYRDSAQNQLKYARWNGEEWLIQVIGNEEWGWHPSLVLDSQDQAHIAYLGSDAVAGSQTPKYAHWTGEMWEIGTIDPVFSSGGISIALDGNEQPHISYLGDFGLRYGIISGTSWLTEVVDSLTLNGVSAGIHSSIVVDDHDQPHISYSRYQTGLMYILSDDLRYATKQNNVWALEDVDTEGRVGWNISSVQDREGQIHTTYFDQDQAAMKYAFQHEAGWRIRVVDIPVDLDGHTSLALDSRGYPHIAYCDERQREVRYARPVSIIDRIFLPFIGLSY